MKILLDMIHLLNKENEDIILIEKLKKFNYKLNKHSQDTEKVLLLCETLYSDLTDLNRQYPYLNDIVLCLVDVFDNIIKDNKRKTKNEYCLKQMIHKMRHENDTLHHDNIKLCCENANKAITNPLVECNIQINGSYTIISTRSIELNTQSAHNIQPTHMLIKEDTKLQTFDIDELIFQEPKILSGTERNILITREKILRDLNPNDLSFSYSDISMCRMPSYFSI
jgi:hypothetical protein